MHPMKFTTRIALLAAAHIALVGCQQQEPAANSPAPSVEVAQRQEKPEKRTQENNPSTPFADATQASSPSTQVALTPGSADTSAPQSSVPATPVHIPSTAQPVGASASTGETNEDTGEATAATPAQTPEFTASPLDTFDESARTLVQHDTISDHPQGLFVRTLRGHPGEVMSENIRGKGLENARVAVRGAEGEVNIPVASTSDDLISFGSESKLPAFPTGAYDLVIYRADGSAVVRKGGIEIHDK